MKCIKKLAHDGAVAASLALAVFALGFPLPGIADTYVVNAQTNSAGGGSGVPTLSLTAGETFTSSVDPSQIWSAGALPRWSNADGLVQGLTLYATGSDASREPAGTLIGLGYTPYLDQFGLTAPYGALVGEINGVYEELGTSFSGPAWATGTLYLFYWDFNAYDNSGSVNVNILPGCAVPEPATWTMMLLGMGTIGFLARGRRVRPVTLA